MGTALISGKMKHQIFTNQIFTKPPEGIPTLT